MGTEAGGTQPTPGRHGRPEARGWDGSPWKAVSGAQACQHIDFRLRAPKPREKTLLRAVLSQLWFCPRSQHGSDSSQGETESTGRRAQ